MISLNEFMKRTIGTKQDVTWANGRLKGQCVSLIQQYLKQCFDYDMHPRGNAKDWDETLVSEGIAKKVKNPKKGDLIVYNPPYSGKYGHIAIYLNNKEMFDQNNGSHDDRKAGVGKLLSHGVYLRMNKALIEEKHESDISETELKDLVIKTIQGIFGNGDARKYFLGKHYDEVQRQVNLNYKHNTVRKNNIKIYK